MAFSIAPLTPDTIEMFSRMVVNYYEDDPGAFPMPLERARRQAEGMLARPNRVSPLLFAMDGEVMGYAILVPYYSNEFGGDMIWLDEFFVCRHARGRGMGSRFIDHLKTWAREQGYIRIELEVHHGNEGARRLYERHGFEVEHRYLLGYQDADPNFK